MTTVRDATFDVFRRFGMTTIFANPGSTEIAFLTGLPDDLEFVLALHEGSVVGIATGYATATGRPALVNLHTTAGLGNAVGALATARTNRVPLVVVVGQQDRRHLVSPAVPGGRPRRAGRQLPGVGEPAGPGAGRAERGRPGLARGERRPRASAGDRAQRRLGRACRRRAARRPGTAAPRNGRRPGRRSTRWPTCWPAPTHRRWSSVPTPTTPPPGPPWSRWPSAWVPRSGRSRSPRAPASRRTTPCSPGTSPPAGRGCARRWPATTSWWPSAPRC